MRRSANIELPISAVVVTLNECRRLRASLESISFCSELIVCDLGSADDSVKIAEEFGATVVHRERVPIVEMLWEELFGIAKHSWILRADPDQEFAEALIEPVKSIMAAPGNVGSVSFPQQNYFFSRPLSVSIWGGTKYIPMLYRRDRTEFTGCVHRGTRETLGSCNKTLHEYAAFPIKHYWVDTFGQMFEKHRRYLRKEGEARLALGQRFSFREMLLDCIRSARTNLISTRGMLGGWRGIFLTGFHIWYVAGCYLSLRRSERNAQLNSTSTLVSDAS